jgi:Flp pilus assembly CpaF family ATPase
MLIEDFWFLIFNRCLNPAITLLPVWNTGAGGTCYDGVSTTASNCLARLTAMNQEKWS